MVKPFLDPHSMIISRLLASLPWLWSATVLPRASAKVAHSKRPTGRAPRGPFRVEAEAVHAPPRPFAPQLKLKQPQDPLRIAAPTAPSA